MRRRGDMAFAPMPRTATVLPSIANSAPSSRRQRMVAWMSWEKATLEMTLSPWARAAAMSSRWAWDLDGGGVTAPDSLDGVMVMFIGNLHSKKGWDRTGTGGQCAPAR